MAFAEYSVATVNNDPGGTPFHLVVRVGKTTHLVSRFKTREEATLKAEKLKSDNTLPVNRIGHPVTKKVKVRWSGMKGLGFSYADAEVEAARRRCSRPDLQWEVQPMPSSSGRYHVVGYTL